MNPSTITSIHFSRINRRDGDVSTMHLKRFLEAFSTPMAAASVQGMQGQEKFRVLHVKRTLVGTA